MRSKPFICLSQPKGLCMPLLSLMESGLIEYVTLVCLDYCGYSHSLIVHTDIKTYK